MVHRINQKDLEVGEQVEKSEHPWASRTVARKIASDHLIKNPSAYSKSGKEEERTVVILNQNVKATMPRKKKKPPAQPQPTGPMWIPNNLRMWG